MQEKIVLITDPPEDHPEVIDEGIALMVDLDRYVLMESNLCATTWSKRPLTLVELVYNTFKPLFCISNADILPSVKFKQWIDWFTWNGSEIKELTGSRPWPPICVSERSDGCLLVIASTKATNALLGVSLKIWYDRHLKAINDMGERKGITLDTIDLPDGSPLHDIPSDLAKKIEVIVLPQPGRNPMTASLYDEKGELFVLRCDYIRRAHQALGCERHAIW
ncbi:MAG: hypothetical protein A4E32_01824 [Methanomassiliicoccales archaeon PtaU1.Bin124]|nr:MAG: hypothetical protein A4E32_01824 [Methanomassiliicoccales archaeon PtaU1.Bin124]